MNIEKHLASPRYPLLYVAGSGHSGSTLLALLLGAHPSIACVGETAVKPAIRSRNEAGRAKCSCGLAVKECPFWTKVFQGVAGLGLVMSPDQWTNDYRPDNPVLRKLHARACASSWTRAVLRWAAAHLPGYSSHVAGVDAVNVAFVDTVLRLSGATVFADTTKPVSRLIHLLRLPQFDIKLVRLIRDVRGYAASAKRRGIAPAAAARTWLRDQTAIAQIALELGSARVHQLRYEDLCGDPDKVLSALWDFCQVKRVPTSTLLEERTSHVLGNAMRMQGRLEIRLDESWRDRLEAAELSGVLRIAGQLNMALGYD